MVGPDAPTPAREKGLQPYGALNCFEWRSEGGAGGRAESHPASSNRQQLCRKQSPMVGTDAPTPARGQGLQPYGALTLFFRWRKKSVQKKASGTATPEAARPAARNSQISAFRALPCPALIFAQACQSLTAFGSCAHWAHAPSRPKLRPAVAPSGLSSSSVRFAHPPGKRLLLPILAAGLAMSRAA